jgi:hypothetical protein
MNPNADMRNLTENLWGQLLQRRSSRGGLQDLHLLSLGWEKLLLGGFIVRFPSPALRVRSSQSTKITITAAQTLPAQSNLLPPQESTAWAAEIRGLHPRAFSFGLFGLLGRWHRILVRVDKRLRNSYTKSHVSPTLYRHIYLYVPSSVSSLIEPNDGRRWLLDLDPSGVLQGEGEESREWKWSPQGIEVSRGKAGFGCKGAVDAIMRKREREALYKGP